MFSDIFKPILTFKLKQYHQIQMVNSPDRKLPEELNVFWDSTLWREMRFCVFFYNRNLQPAVWRAFNDSSSIWSKSFNSLTFLDTLTNCKFGVSSPRFCGATFDFQLSIFCNLCFICSGCICSCTAEGKLRLVWKYWSNVVLSHKSEISYRAVQPASPVLHQMLLFSFSCCSLNGVSNIRWYINTIKLLLHTWVFAHIEQQLVECCDFNITSRAISLTDIKMLIKSRLE